MSNPDRSWTLDGFPERVVHPDGDPPDEVQKAYEAWLETRRINPRRGARRLQGDDIRYTAEVPGAHYVNQAGGWQLMCDYDVDEGNWSVRGRAVYVGMGYVEAGDLDG
ncbi:hypothetical protein AB0F72_08800 [Actinoplanes sp. NPDC023936]|uniref:hypothetical protein n=1 Tax=Actinoplanes sp. NPDC023936 TaxID=3154910 RepID=UPI00340C4606